MIIGLKDIKRWYLAPRQVHKCGFCCVFLCEKKKIPSISVHYTKSLTADLGRWRSPLSLCTAGASPLHVPWDPLCSGHMMHPHLHILMNIEEAKGSSWRAQKLSISYEWGSLWVVLFFWSNWKIKWRRLKRSEEEKLFFCLLYCCRGYKKAIIVSNGFTHH